MNKNSDKEGQKTTINWYPGHMAKAKREMQQILPQVDLVYEVIDARIPITSRVQEGVSFFEAKPSLLIATKYDLCDPVRSKNLFAWYQEQGVQVVPVDLVTGKGLKDVLEATKPYQEKLQLSRKKKGLLPRPLRVLVVGIPNVGKSTLINRLAGKKKVEVADRPGVTKALSWIKLKDNLELLDSPGILWPKLDPPEVGYRLAAFLAIRQEVVDTEALAYYVLEQMKKSYQEALATRYGVSSFDSSNEALFAQIGKRRGAVEKGGEVSYEKVYDLLLRDLRSGALGKVTFDERPMGEK